MSGPEVDYSRPAMEIIGQIDALTQKVKAVNESRAAFVAERARMVTEIIDKIRALKLKNSENGGYIETLRQDLAKKQEELNTLTEKVANGDSSGKLLSEEIEKLRTEISDRNTELTELRKELIASKAKEEDSKREVDTLNETVKQLNTEITRLESELSDSTKQNQQITREKEQEISEITRQLEDAKRQLEDAKGKLEEAKGKLEVANRQLEETNARNEEAQQGLKTQIAELKAQLASSKEMQQLANVRSSELEEAINNITNNLSATYDNLKNEIEKLLNVVNQDDVEQQKLLRSILEEIGHEHEAISLSQSEEAEPRASESAPSNELTVGDKATIIELDKAINTFFTLINGNYVLKKNAFHDPKVSILRPINISDELKRKLYEDPENNADTIQKLELFENELSLYTKKTKGGRRKRSTAKRMKKRPLNKKVTRKNAKRRRTQKKRRPIRKRRTARK